MIPNGWKRLCVADVADVITGTTPPTADPCNYGGNVPFVTPGDLGEQKYIFSTAKYLSATGVEKARVIPQGSTLFTCIGSTIGKMGMAGRPLTTNQQINAAVPKKVSAEFLYYALCHITKDVKRIAGVQAVPIINKTQFGQQVILVPLSEKVQEKVASLLSYWDAAIDKTERLIAAMEQCLKVLREQQMRRSHQSKRITLHEVTRECCLRNSVRLGRNMVMAVTKEEGMRPMKEETIAANIDRYKIVPSKAFAYNPMRLNIGSIVMSPFDADVLVSPDYVVFECDKFKLLPGYLNHLRYTRQWANFFESAGSGSVRVRIYYDHLSAFTFHLPPVEAQKRIVDLLDTSVLEIDLLKKQADAYRKQKRGLMQKLLTGEWRVKHGVKA